MVLIEEAKSKTSIKEVTMVGIDDVMGLGGFTGFTIFDKNDGTWASNLNIVRSEGGYGTLIRGSAVGQDDIYLVAGNRKSRILGLPVAEIRAIGVDQKRVIFYHKKGVEITLERA